MEWPWNREDLADVWTWPHLFWLNIFGWWGEDAKTEFARKWLTRLRTLSIVYFFFFIVSMMIQVSIKLADGDIMENLFTIFATGPGIVGLFKFVEFVICRKTLKSVMDRLSDLINEINTPILEAMARRYFKRTWIVFFLSLTVFDSIVLHWALRPILAALIQGEKTRIVDGWPVYVDTWTQVFLSYLFQVPGVIILGHSFYIFSQIVLNDKKSTTEELIACVKYHSKILCICNDFRDVTSRVIIWQCVNTVMMLCTGIFILTYLGKNINSNAAMNLGEVSFSLTTCLYFYCWYSNEITYQCTDVSNSLYMMNWTNGKSSDKKTMIITMSRAMHPVQFGGILQITLNTFINVLKTTFSFYNFLIAVRMSTSQSN